MSITVDPARIRRIAQDLLDLAADLDGFAATPATARKAAAKPTPPQPLRGKGDPRSDALRAMSFAATRARTAALRDKIGTMLGLGLDVQRIADALNLQRATIRKYLVQLGREDLILPTGRRATRMQASVPPPKPPKLSPADKLPDDVLRAAVEAGNTDLAIARHYGVTSPYVTSRRTALGIEGFNPRVFRAVPPPPEQLLPQPKLPIDDAPASAS